MKVLNLVLIASLSALFIGCELKLKGKVDVYEVLNFNYKTKEKDQRKRAKKGLPLTFALMPGSYASKAEVDSDDFEIYVPAALGDQKILFKIPDSKKLPKHGGKLSLSSYETKQPYGLDADVAISYEDGPRINSTEYCTEAFYYEDCNCNEALGQVQCTERTTYLSGDKDVTYYMQDKITDVVVDLVAPNSATVSATFMGTNVDTSKIYTYQSACHIPHYKKREIRRSNRHEIRQCRAQNGHRRS